MIEGHMSIQNLHSWIEVDKSAIRANISMLSTIAKKNNKSFMLMIKANAYGHGSVEIAKIAQEEGSEFLGIAHIEEAPLIRGAGVTTKLMLFTEPKISFLPLLNELNVIVIISNLNSLAELMLLPKRLRPVFHLKFNTGLNRFGFDMDEIDSVISCIQRYNIVPDGILTHFSASPDNISTTENEFKKFRNIIMRFAAAGITPRYVHSSNSAASVWLKEQSTNLVRLGLAAYGLQPNSSRLLKLKPCMNWRTRVIAFRTIDSGTKIGYAGSWEASRKSIIGILSCGYSDGLRRGPSHQDHVLYSGQRLPIVGAVMMNHCFVDLTDVRKKPVIGDVITIFGNDGFSSLLIETVADQLGTSNEEVATTALPNMPRMYM